MKLILETHCADDSSSANPLMILELNSENISLMASRIRLLEEVSEKDKELHQINFWDSSPELFDSTPGFERKLGAKKFREVEDVGFVVTDKDFFPKDDDIIRTDLWHMIVTRSGDDYHIEWECFLKNSDVRISSKRILLGWIRGEMGPGPAKDILDQLADSIMHRIENHVDINPQV